MANKSSISQSGQCLFEGLAEGLQVMGVGSLVHLGIREPITHHDRSSGGRSKTVIAIFGTAGLPLHHLLEAMG